MVCFELINDVLGNFLPKKHAKPFNWDKNLHWKTLKLLYTTNLNRNLRKFSTYRIQKVSHFYFSKTCFFVSYNFDKNNKYLKYRKKREKKSDIENFDLN